MRTAKSAKMRCILGATLVATFLPVMSNAGQFSSDKVDLKIGEKEKAKSAYVTSKSFVKTRKIDRSAASITAGGVTGISAGGVTGISAGGVTGISAGGVTGISAGGVTGISAGGVTGISAGGVTGISAGGVTGISAGGVTGISAGGVTGISAGGVTGISAGGVTGISAGGVTGISAGGVTGISAGGVTGISAGGVTGISAGGVTGISAGGVTGISAGGVTGISAGGLSGISVGGLYFFDDSNPVRLHLDPISDNVLSGPVENIDSVNGVFTSMGQTVLASQSMLSQLSVGDLVTVDGSVMGAGWIYADAVDVSRDTYVPGATPVFVTGLMSDMDPSIGRAQVGALEVDYTATLSSGSVPDGNFYRFYGIQPEGKGVLLSDLVLAER